MRIQRAVLVLSLSLSLMTATARAEGGDAREDLAETKTRLHGVTTVIPMPDGGLISLGASLLKVQRPGTNRFEVLHHLPGDSLYRAVGNERGDVLAVWEKDPHVHLFTRKPKAHRTLPKPRAPPEVTSMWQVHALAFAPGAGHAYVHTEGQNRGEGWLYLGYRMPLVGRGEAEVLYRRDGAVRLLVKGGFAAFMIPDTGAKGCDHRRCSPVGEIGVYELSGDRAVWRQLVDGATGPFEGATVLFGDYDGVALALHRARNERSLLRWRPGEARGRLQPFTRATDGKLHVTREGDVILLVQRDAASLNFEVYAPDGSARVHQLPSAHDRFDDTRAYSVGRRQNGGHWMQWGDYLLLLGRDPGASPRAVYLEPLLQRRSEWAGVAVYLPGPEVLWLAIEERGGRDMVRLPFTDLEKRAKPWRAVQPASARTP